SGSPGSAAKDAMTCTSGCRMIQCPTASRTCDASSSAASKRLRIIVRNDFLVKGGTGSPTAGGSQRLCEGFDPGERPVHPSCVHLFFLPLAKPRLAFDPIVYEGFLASDGFA